MNLTEYMTLSAKTSLMSPFVRDFQKAMVKSNDPIETIKNMTWGREIERVSQFVEKVAAAAKEMGMDELHMDALGCLGALDDQKAALGLD